VKYLKIPLHAVPRGWERRRQFLSTYRQMRENRRKPLFRLKRSGRQSSRMRSLWHLSPLGNDVFRFGNGHSSQRR
jgi:hypothetical protein